MPWIKITDLDESNCRIAKAFLVRTIDDMGPPTAGDPSYVPVAAAMVHVEPNERRSAKNLPCHDPNWGGYSLMVCGSTHYWVFTGAGELEGIIFYRSNRGFKTGPNKWLANTIFRMICERTSNA